MTKTAALKTSTALEVVKSPKLPATRRPRAYGDFDAFVANVDRLSGFFKRVHGDIVNLDVQFYWLEEPDNQHLNLEGAKQQILKAESIVALAKEKLPEFPRIRKHLAEALRDAKWYDREELYDVKGRGKSKQWTLSRRVVAEQIALLLASFQNSRPGTPKVFAKMLVEEIYANNPNACVLESACRRVRREKSFPPSIAEVLKAIHIEESAWCDRWNLVENGPGEDAADHWQPQLEEAIGNAESMIAKAKAKLAAREVVAKAKHEAWLKANAAYSRGRRDAKRGEPMAVPPEFDENEVGNYRLGFEMQLKHDEDYGSGEK